MGSIKASNTNAMAMARPTSCAGQVHHLIVEEQQDGLKAVVLDAKGDGAEAVEDFRAHAGEFALLAALRPCSPSR